MAKKDLPAMPLYIGDWKKDPIVQMMSTDDEGIYLRILMLMWESDKRGYLLINGSKVDENTLAEMIHLDNQRLTMWLTKYQNTFHIFGNTPEGVLFSRKHIKLVELSEKRKNAGKQGGNPYLVNQNLTKRLTNDEDTGYSNAEDENENEKKSFKEGGTGETKLDPPDERKSEYGGPAFKEVKEFFISNKRTEDEALVFWNEYEGKHWFVIGKEDAPKRKMKTTKDWMMKAEQWFVKARKEELDKPKSNIQTKTENSTYQPAPGYKHKISPLCECGCGKPWTMRLREDEKSPYFRVASKECFQKCVSKNKSAFEELADSMNAALTKTTKLSKTKQEVV
jgi:hypothetical protein